MTSADTSIPSDVLAAGLGDEAARRTLVENMAAAYIGALVYHDTERPATLITGFRAAPDATTGALKAFEIEVVGEWLTITVELVS